MNISFQTELNAVVCCLEEGVSQINVLKGDETEAKPETPVETPPEPDQEAGSDKKEAKMIFLSDAVEAAGNDNFDEVFEAFVGEERCGSGFDDDDDDDGDDPMWSKSTLMTGRSSGQVFMMELKQVLVGKAEEHRAREEKALERLQQKGEKLFFLVRVPG